MVTWTDLFIGNAKKYSKNPFKHSWIAKSFRTPTSETMPFKRKAFFSYLCHMTEGLQAYTDNAQLAAYDIEQWSKLRLPHWQRILDVLATEYEPLWNYNRTDEETRAEAETSDGNSEDQVAGYDSGSLVQNAAVSSTADRDLTAERKLHAYGNIGVMSTQDLLQQEVDVALISLYNIIIDEFKEQFCILVY